METAGWDDIGYNYLVGEDGNAYEGRGWDHQGAQVRKYNSVSLGFSVIGNYNSRLPSSSALAVVKQLIACALQKVRTPFVWLKVSWGRFLVLNPAVSQPSSLIFMMSVPELSDSSVCCT